MNYYVKNFGCKVNQSDGAGIYDTLKTAGLFPVEDYKDADIAIINSCAVTKKAIRKLEQFIRQVRKQSHAEIYVCGCAARTAELKENVVQCPDTAQMLNMLGADCKILSSTSSERTRAFLKIQDGCENYCSYCIIPYTRGKLSSRPVDEVISSVDKLLEKGFCEIVLIGIHLGMYGHPHSGVLEKVVRKCLEKPDLKRLRLGSIEPNEVSDELLDIISESSMFARHLHIPLQSGSDVILERMNRRYSSEDFLSVVHRIRCITDMEITTDIICGFPGETEEDFIHTVNICRHSEFSGMHIFPFSPRNGTPAAVMNGKIPREVSVRRAEVLKDLKNDLALRRKKAYIGKKAEVLVEHSNEGFTSQYIRCRITGSAADNELVQVYVTEAGETLLAERV